MANWLSKLFNRESSGDEERVYERRMRIVEGVYDSPEALHFYIAQALMFPDHYGNNLDALNDCLREVCVPTKVVIRRILRKPGDKPNWFDELCKVFQVCGAESTLLDVFIEDFVPEAEAAAAPSEAAAPAVPAAQPEA